MTHERTARAYVTHADAAPAYWLIGVLWRVLATGIQTGGTMCLLDQLCSPGSGPPRHTHPQDEGLYVVKGAVTFNAGGRSFSAGAGSLVSVPRHTEHSFLVDEQAVLINFYFPAGFELWLMGSALPAERNELPPADAAMPPLALMKRLSDDYGGLPLTQERTTSPNPDAASLPTLSSRMTAESRRYDGGCWSILAEGATTGGGHSVFEVEMPQGPADRPHIHDLTDVGCYVLDGSIDVLIDDEVYGVGQGSFVFIPRGSVRAFRVTSSTARYLIFHTSAGYERLLRAFGSLADGAGVPPDDFAPLPVPIERLQALHADLGIRTVNIPSGFAA